MELHRERPERDILIDHARRYPHWELGDVYKLVHQGALGREHAVSDGARARTWLVRELAELGPGPDEPLVDPISPDGAIVRVHLRPYVRLGLEPEQLLQAFLRTAREFRGSPGEVERGLMEAARLAREGLLAFHEADVLGFVARMEAGGLPATRHSAAFGAEYRPAYRVVAREYLPVDQWMSRR
ncbi:MAG: hypothetical protein NTV92_04025 [Candidatus Bipolaricaulota bacterium]|nr:hypothetical protein [Candidatus Bipolaricaulota bacterium]